MDVYTTEEQQVEALKHWLRKNGVSVGVGIVIGLALVFGYSYWQQQQHQQQVLNSVQLEAVLQAQAEGLSTEQQALLNRLADSKDGSYSLSAQLLLAKAQVDAGKLPEAEQHLQQALTENRDSAVALIIRERLIRVLIAQNKLDQADKVLADAKDPEQAFKASLSELKGDLLRARGDKAGARTAYEQAVAATTNPSPLLTMKLEQLPTLAVAGAK